MIALPSTGVAMGYFGGKGLPFFGTHIPGKPVKEEGDGAIAKNAFKAHKVLSAWIPLRREQGMPASLAGSSNLLFSSGRPFTPFCGALQLMGQGLEVLVPLHVGATGAHYLMGQKVLGRMWK